MEVADRDFTQGLQLLLRAHTLAGEGQQRNDDTITRAANKIRQRATEMMTREATVAHAGDGHPFTRGTRGGRHG